MVGKTLSESIIRSKIHRPPIGLDFIRRPRLLERLEKYRQRPLTLVTAPAGYGKSVLISNWLEGCDCPSAWVSLDKNDNDLSLFLSYFLSAIQSIFPDAGRKTLALVNAPSLPSMSAVAGSFLNELELIEQPFIVVLDDYQHIHNESLNDLLIRLLSHPPQSMHLVMIGRRDPALPIFALRAKGQVTEIRTQELRFTKSETAEYLEQFAGLQIDPSTASALEEKTEGWVTGLRLAALSMRHRGNLDPSLLEPAVDAQYVMEYLFNEVFSQQPPEFSQYLLGTAILDRFCGPLCEAVCAPGAEPFTCEMSGWEFVAWLKRENLFLISLDAENRWVRYHHLFRKLLVNQLNRRCSAEEIKALHAQASAWFFENDLIEEALQHALAAGDAETAGSLVVRAGHQMMNNEQWPRLERCLHMLPRGHVKRDPALLVLEGWLHHVRQN
jgi:LuxR family maltose regulon positive regulatory protein